MRRTSLIITALGLAIWGLCTVMPASAQEDSASLGSVLAEKLRLFPARSRAQQQQRGHHPQAAPRQQAPRGGQPTPAEGAPPANTAPQSSRRPASERRPVPPPATRVEQFEVEDAQPASRAPRRRGSAIGQQPAPQVVQEQTPSAPAGEPTPAAEPNPAAELAPAARPGARVARRDKSLAERMSAARRMNGDEQDESAEPEAAQPGAAYGEDSAQAPVVPSTEDSFAPLADETLTDDAPSDELQPIVVEEPTPAEEASRMPSPVTAAPTASVEPSPVTPAPPVAPRTRPAEVHPAVGGQVQSPTATNVSPADDVLMARQSPLIAVETVGPRRVLVGREAVYKLTVNNSGSVAAGGVQVQIIVPEGAEVVSLEPTTGETVAPEGAPAGTIVWVLQQLAGGAHEELVLRIVPRTSRPFDLAVQWAFASQATQTLVEVQEPKLVMTLSGPEEIRFGRTAQYKLIVSNPGTGEAENVYVRLLPGTLDRASGETFQVGTLHPNESRTLEFEVTARQAGTLAVQAEANAEAGLQATVTGEVLVRKAGLKLDMAAPRMIYAGAPVTYKFALSNPGNAPAQNIRIVAPLIEGAKVTDAGRGQVDAARGQVIWVVPVLPAGGREDLELHCELTAAGVARQALVATADDQLEASQTAVTQVEALADLELDVADPQGPVPVGQEFFYTIRVRNNGTKAAEGIDVVGFFSDGVEPQGAQGAGHQVAPGQVVFDRFGALPPGREIVLKIRAHAQAAGNHVFRAEVQCESTGATLAVEETTRVYAEAGAEPVEPAMPAAGVPEPAPVQP